MVLLDFHMMFNEGVIDKGNGTMELARRFKTFEDEHTRIGVKCCNHWGKKTIHQRSHTDKLGPLGHLQIKPNLILIILQMAIILQFDVMLLAEKALL